MKKGIEWGVRVISYILGNKAVLFPYYYVVVPVMVWLFGRALTAALLIPIQIVIVILLVQLYDLCGDVFGIEKIKAPFRNKWDGLGKRWGKAKCLVKISTFLLLCDQTDPFTVFVCFRRKGKTGVDRKGFALIVLVTVLITVYWVQVSLGLIFVTVWLVTKLMSVWLPFVVKLLM